MKRKSICLFLWLLLIGLSYGGGYLCMAWPLSQSKVVGEPEIIPVTAGKFYPARHKAYSGDR